MTKSEYKDLSIQRSFDLERAVETIEKQEALIKDLRETILAYSSRVNMYEKKVGKLRKNLGEEMDTMSKIKNLLK
tara:strand:- start:253 stop:477 length:225 start_codon:yes stop_codon:yes gene_type:complete